MLGTPTRSEETLAQRARAAATRAVLIRAMEDTAPACDGLETFTRDKFVEPEEAEIMRGICAECALFDLCAAYASAGRPAAGMWAGIVPRTDGADGPARQLDAQSRTR